MTASARCRYASHDGEHARSAHLHAERSLRTPKNRRTTTSSARPAIFARSPWQRWRSNRPAGRARIGRPEMPPAHRNTCAQPSGAERSALMRAVVTERTIGCRRRSSFRSPRKRLIVLPGEWALQQAASLRFAGAEWRPASTIGVNVDGAAERRLLQHRRKKRWKLPAFPPARWSSSSRKPRAMSDMERARDTCTRLKKLGAR